MVKTDRERCAVSHKADIFYFWIEDSPKVESGDVSETVGAVLPYYTVSYRKNNSLYIHRKESPKSRKRMNTNVTERKTREETERGRKMILKWGGYVVYVGQSKSSRNSSDWKSATIDSIWSKNDHRGVRTRRWHLSRIHSCEFAQRFENETC